MSDANEKRIAELEAELAALRRVAGPRAKGAPAKTRAKGASASTVTKGVSTSAVAKGASASTIAKGARRSTIADQARLAAIVEFSDDAIQSEDLECRITSWNRAAERLYGYTVHEVLGRPMSMLTPPGFEDEPKALLELILSGESVVRYETERQRKGGARVEVSLTISALRDTSGTIVGASVITRDLSEQRRVEATLRRNEEQLRQAQKMEAIGKLAGGIAHDFNNLLSVILSYSEFVTDALAAEDPIAADVLEIRRAGERARDLTRQLLAFSRRQALRPRVIDVNQTLEGMERLLRRLLRADISLVIRQGASMGSVFADPTQVEQIVMNLVVNAADAMPAGGLLALETSNVDLDSSTASEQLGVSAGSYMKLVVSDTGSGMDAATSARIFEPFFTTKDVGKGTGLGLSTVYGIVKQSEGGIQVRSEPGHGTAFEIYLPSIELEAEAIDERPIPTTLQGRETILLVEDEEQVRAVARTVLRRRGYKVIEAQNGNEGFLLCEQYADEIHLMLTDVVMPGMSGRQLAQRVAVLRPAMKVIYMSGYADHSILRPELLDRGVTYIQKPITPDVILKKVREVLDGTS